MSLIMLSPETLLKFALFGCKNTAQLVLMSVCLSVRGQPFYIILQHPECSRMYAECMQNVPKCSRIYLIFVYGIPSLTHSLTVSPLQKRRMRGYLYYICECTQVG